MLPVVQSKVSRPGHDLPPDMIYPCYVHRYYVPIVYKEHPHKTHLCCCALALLALLRYKPYPCALPLSLFQHDSRAIAWVDETLLAQAHKRLPPADLYYPVDELASRQGRWQQQAEEALEECGYAYFLPSGGDNVGDDVGDDVDNNGSGIVQAEGSGREDNEFSASPGLAGREQRPRAGQRRPATSKTVSRSAGLKSRRKAMAAEVAARGILEKQSHGLKLEIKRATHVASTTFKVGDRVESRWRRPTRLDKPRLDPSAWHVGLVVQSHKDGARVDVVFEDGEGERLSGIPAKYVRLAPFVLALRQPLVSSAAAGGDMAAAGRKTLGSSCAPTPMPIESLCPASRRELAHIASANTSLRRTWENPVPIDQELDRLQMLGEEKMRSRPEWQGSFPLLDFQAAKRLSLGAGTAGAGMRQPAAVTAAARDRRRERCQGPAPSRGVSRTQTRKSAEASLLAKRRMTTAQAERKDEGYRPAQPDFSPSLAANDAISIRRGSFSSSSSSSPSPASSPALVASQAELVAAAMAYDRCVAGARDCLDRGAAAFRMAHTYSEQQKAFEESTAVLGPAQPGRAGYTDWRGSAVVGLQNATLDVVEAMESWAEEWAAARESKAGARQDGGLDREESGGGKNRAVDREKGVEWDGVVAVAPVTAPPFLWEGSPLVSTIIGQSAKLLAGAPELKEWYGPGFPIERNPFFLAYPIDSRPVTPRNALVRAWVDGEVRCGQVSSFHPLFACPGDTRREFGIMPTIVAHMCG